MRHPVPRHPAFWAAIAAAWLAGTGCNSGGGKTYTVEVDAISEPGETGDYAPPAKSYVIAAHNPRLNPDSLRHKEVADYVRTALSAKGMYEAASPAKADIVIDIDYGVDAPRIKYETIQEPIIEQEEGHVVEGYVRVIEGRGLDGRPIEIMTKVVDYIPGATTMKGTQENVNPVIVYEKYLKISARSNHEPQEGRAPAEVWSVNVSTEDGGDELRRVMPILASATADYIGENTREEVPVRIAEGDDVVAFVKKGM